jgi:hypothetical protein
VFASQPSAVSRTLSPAPPRESIICFNVTLDGSRCHGLLIAPSGCSHRTPRAGAASPTKWPRQQQLVGDRDHDARRTPAPTRTLWTLLALLGRGGRYCTGRWPVVPNRATIVVRHCCTVGLQLHEHVALAPGLLNCPGAMSWPLPSVALF